MDDDKIELSGYEEGTRLRRSSRFVIGTLKVQNSFEFYLISINY